MGPAVQAVIGPMCDGPSCTSWDRSSVLWVQLHWLRMAQCVMGPSAQAVIGPACDGPFCTGCDWPNVWRALLHRLRLAQCVMGPAAQAVTGQGVWWIQLYRMIGRMWWVQLHRLWSAHCDGWSRTGCDCLVCDGSSCAGCNYIVCDGSSYTGCGWPSVMGPAAQARERERERKSKNVIPFRYLGSKGVGSLFI